MTEITYVTDFELELIHYVERFHASMGSSPSDAQMLQRFDLQPDALAAFKTNPLVLKSFKARGIFYPAAEDCFSPEQMHAAAVMTDLLDRRSDEKKLRDLGLTSRQWSMWVQNDTFAEYLKDRSEKFLANSVHEAHKGLLKGVRSGNVQSVKAFYEITGRYRPDAEQQIDLRSVLHTFIEVIQKYVKDPIVMHKIAMDLSSIASLESMNAQNFARPALEGSVVSNFPSPPSIEG